MALVQTWEGFFSPACEEHPDGIMEKFIILSSKVCHTMFEPYNAAPSCHQRVEHADDCMLLDTEDMYDICFHAQRLAADLIHLVSAALCGVTTCVRFPPRRVSRFSARGAPSSTALSRFRSAQELMCAAVTRHGLAAALFRGRQPTKETHEQKLNVQNKNSSDRRVDSEAAVCDIPPEWLKMAVLHGRHLEV